jgi:Tfp pilus assembly protein PilV
MNLINNYRPRQNGFTLVEVVIFMVVVLIGITTLMKVSSTVLTDSGEATVRTQAVTVAETILSQYMDYTVQELSALPTQATIAEKSSNYTSTVNLTPCPSCMQIDVTTKLGKLETTLFAVQY